jgi:hypothetical protein
LIASLGISPLTHFCLISLVVGIALLASFPHLLSEKQPVLGGRAEKAPLFQLPGTGLVALGLIALCSMVGEGAMADWSAVYLKQTVETSEGLAAAGYAAFSITMAIGRFMGDGLRARFGSVSLVRNGALLAATGMLCLLLVPHPFFVLIGFACVGAGFSNIVPLVFSAAGRTPAVTPAIAVACVTTMGYFGFLAGPPLIGFTAQLLGLRSALGIIVVTGVAMVLLAPNLTRKTSRLSPRRDGKTDRNRPSWKFAVPFLVQAFVVIGPWSGRADDKTPPAFHYWHMWTDDKGVSHVGSFVMHDFVLKSMNPPADPQWQDKLKAEGASLIITVQPVGWIGPWHEDPKPQWIVPLSGRWFIKTMDGTRVEMGPGDVCFGEDQNTKPDAFGHKGHYSGTLGKEPAVLMVVQMHGDDDQIVPYPDSAPLSAKLLKNSTLKTYKGFPHGMPTTEADTINADLLTFLKA